MTKTVRLNDLQLVLLSNAAARENGSLVPLPESCAQDTTRVGKAVALLLRRKFVEEIVVIDRSLAWREEDQEMIGLFITDTDRAAICAGDEQETEDDPANVGEQITNANHDATAAQSASPRAGSKIAAVIELLERDEGATLDEMTAATGWLPHTTRAALTGLKKKGHVMAKTKRGDVTCYHIAGEA